MPEQSRAPFLASSGNCRGDDQIIAEVRREGLADICICRVEVASRLFRRTSSSLRIVAL